LGLHHERDQPQLFTGGLQMRGDLDIEHALGRVAARGPMCPLALV
jgi:hypothetical protein